MTDQISPQQRTTKVAKILAPLTLILGILIVVDWEVLCRYLDHGRVEIDNNIIENARGVF